MLKNIRVSEIEISWCHFGNGLYTEMCGICVS